MSTTDILLAGALAAFSVDLLIYPLDTIKTRLQAHSPAPPLTSISYRNLYHGVGPVVLATLPASATFFTVYEFLHHTLPSHSLSTALASSIAELASCAILTPAEVVKQNAQILPPPSVAGAGEAAGRVTTSASLQAFRNIGSWHRLWTGYGTLAGRNLPFTAIQFSIFEPLKTRLGIHRGEQFGESPGKGVVETTWQAGLAAGGSGAVAAVLTTPVDVVKTRIMVAAGRSPEREGKRVRDVVREVMREEGVKGFWRGGGVRAVWTMVGGGLYLGVFEGGKVGIGRWRRGQWEGGKEREGV